MQSMLSGVAPLTSEDHSEPEIAAIPVSIPVEGLLVASLHSDVESPPGTCSTSAMPQRQNPVRRAAWARRVVKPKRRLDPPTVEYDEVQQHPDDQQQMRQLQAFLAYPVTEPHPAQQHREQ